MAKTFFILGGRRFKGRRCPVMRDFLDRASDIWALAHLDLTCPKVGADKLKELATAKNKLLKK
jgi:hypothetical protein